MGFLMIDGKKVPVPDAFIDYLMEPPSDEETATPAGSSSAVPKAAAPAVQPTMNCLGPSPHHQVTATYWGLSGPPPEAPQTAPRLFPGPALNDGMYTLGVAGVSAPKAEASQLPEQTASRWTRVTRPKARDTLTALVQAEQKRKHMIVTPPCSWCGLPTGCFCDTCRKSVCSACDKALSQCVDCAAQQMGVTEGKAREHAALILKKHRGEDDDGVYRFGQNVDPAFLALPFEDQARLELSFQNGAKIFVESGAPVDPHAQLQQRERPEPEESRPRQLTTEELLRLEESGNKVLLAGRAQQRGQAAASQREKELAAAARRTLETERNSAIAALNDVARANRAALRHGVVWPPAATWMRRSPARRSEGVNDNRPTAPSEQRQNSWPPAAAEQTWLSSDSSCAKAVERATETDQV
eukprot:s274_g31.t1